VYQGAYDSAGNRIIAGFPYGGEGVEGGWIPWIVGGPTPIAPGVPTLMFGFSTGIFKYFIHQDPDWVYTTQSFDNFAELSRLAGSVLNATNPDLSAFSERGGKLLMWHGWSDPALSANASVDYYEAVRAGDEQADSYLRLFMLPGVLHCGGGPGPYRVDYVSPIENWVENGEPPTKLIAGYTGEDGKPSGGRPICAYPETARHTGGDNRQPGNFVCENHSER
jgi:feruloyl esterase